MGIDQLVTGGDVDDPVVDSLNTDHAAITERLHRNYSQTNPHLYRGPEASGAPVYRPHPKVDNPVITPADVNNDTSLSDVTSCFDPFVVKEAGTYYLFFEVTRSGNPKQIAYATSTDGETYTTQGLVFNDGQARSYPWIQKLDGTWYMVPEEKPDMVVYSNPDLTDDPTNWTKEETAISGSGTVDFTPVYWDGRWYAFASNVDSNQVELYYADNEGEAITGHSWSEHPSSPVHTTSGSNISRLGGRAINTDRTIYVFYQGDSSNMTRCYAVDELSTSAFSDTEAGSSPAINKSVSGWNSKDMHHLDPMIATNHGAGLVAVDGKNDSDEVAIGVYTPSNQPLDDWRAYLDTDITVNAGGSDAEITNQVDSDLGLNTEQGGNRYQAPVSGWYIAEARVTWQAPSATGYTLQANLRHFDGSTNTDYDQDFAEVNISGHNVTNKLASGVRYLEAGDRFILDVDNNDPNNSHTVLSGENATWLSVTRVA